jgi:hypothetical protein
MSGLILTLLGGPGAQGRRVARPERSDPVRSDPVPS